MASTTTDATAGNITSGQRGTDGKLSGAAQPDASLGHFARYRYEYTLPGGGPGAQNGKPLYPYIGRAWVPAGEPAREKMVLPGGVVAYLDEPNTQSAARGTSPDSRSTTPALPVAPAPTPLKSPDAHQSSPPAPSKPPAAQQPSPPAQAPPPKPTHPPAQAPQPKSTQPAAQTPSPAVPAPPAAPVPPGKAASQGTPAPATSPVPPTRQATPPVLAPRSSQGSPAVQAVPGIQAAPPVLTPRGTPPSKPTPTPPPPKPPLQTKAVPPTKPSPNIAGSRATDNKLGPPLVAAEPKTPLDKLSLATGKEGLGIGPTPPDTSKPKDPSAPQPHKVTDADVAAVKGEFVSGMASSLVDVSMESLLLVDPVVALTWKPFNRWLRRELGLNDIEPDELDESASSLNPAQEAMTFFALAEERSAKALELLKAGKVDEARRAAAAAGSAYAKHVNALGVLITVAHGAVGLVKGAAGTLRSSIIYALRDELGRVRYIGRTSRLGYWWDVLAQRLSGHHILEKFGKITLEPDALLNFLDNQDAEKYAEGAFTDYFRGVLKESGDGVEWLGNTSKGTPVTKGPWRDLLWEVEPGVKVPLRASGVEPPAKSFRKLDAYAKAIREGAYEIITKDPEMRELLESLLKPPPP